jgi:hypothetical protein
MRLSNGEYQLEELLICGAIDPDALTIIEKSLLDARTAGEASNDFFQIDRENRIMLHAGRAPVESLRHITGAIRRFHADRRRMKEAITIQAAIVPFQLEPRWHAEVIPEAFVVTTVQATEGLSGRVPGQNMSEAAEFVLNHALSDPEFETLSGVRIVRPPVHSLIHLPYGAFHRSPVPTADTPPEKLIINAVVLPTFRH